MFFCVFFDKKGIFICIFLKLFIILQTKHSKMAEEITHDGIVERVDGQTARVRIVQQSACSGCHAKSMCQASEMMIKAIDCEIGETMNVGDRVEVCVQQSLGWKAVFYSFVLPMALMMALLFVGQRFWADPSWLSGTVAIGSLAPYYLILHQFEGRFRRQYRFVARKNNTNN